MDDIRKILQKDERNTSNSIKANDNKEELPKKRCIDCPKVECRVVFFKKGEWEGYCRVVNRKVSGNDVCTAHVQDTKAAMHQQLSLF